jgi:lipid-A-disaccharide synthase
MIRRIFISTGEVSGDKHGAALVNAIRGLAPDVVVNALGSDHLRAAGAHLVADLSARSTIGFVEPIVHVPYFLWLWRRLKKHLRAHRPDVVVLIDFQGFNLILAKYARKLGIPTVYYIPPQEWIWGTRKGTSDVVRTSSLILSVFEKEKQFYEAQGGNVEYIGHPLVDMVREYMGCRGNASPVGANLCIRPGVGVDGVPRLTVALFPGSRKQEIQKLLPVMLAVAEKFPQHHYTIAVASPALESQINTILRKKNLITDHCSLFTRNPYDLLSTADLVITSSGTTTLEAALFHTPMVVIYKLSKLSYWIATHLMKVKLKFIALPNILAEEAIVPEFILNFPGAEQSFKQAVARLLEDDSARMAMQERLMSVADGLGSPGAVTRAAERILGMENP